MKKIYNLIALAILMIVGTAGAQAQKYYVPDPSSGENVQEIEEGVDYVIMSARYPDTYLCGEGLSSLIKEECLYQFEKAGKNADGDMTWRIKHSIDNKYILAKYGLVYYTDMEEEAFVCQIRQPRYYEYVPNEGDENYDDYNADKFATVSPGGENSWVILEEKERETYLCLSETEDDARFYVYKSINALRIVKVKEAENAQLVSLCMADLYPRLVGYVAGDGPGQCSQEALDEATAAYAACEELVNTNSNDTETCNAAVNRLKAAMAALEASIKDMTEGYYYMVNLGRTGENGGAVPYNVVTNSTTLWDYYGDLIPETPNVESVPYIWQFTQEGDVWYIKNVVTGKYIGSASDRNTALPVTDTPFGYNIKAATDLKSSSGESYIGYFNIRNPDDGTYYFLHAAESGQAVVYGYAANDTYNHASAWKFVKVDETSLNAALEAYKPIKLQADIENLIDEASQSYNSTKICLGGATPDDQLDEMGLVGPGQLSTNAPEPREGSLDELTDSDFSTFFHSSWSNDAPAPNDWHYLEADLGVACQNLVMKYVKRDNYKYWTSYSPTKVTILSADSPEGPWNEECTIDLPYQYKATYTTLSGGECDPVEVDNSVGIARFEMGAPHQYIRIVVKETIDNTGTKNGYPYFYWSELRIYEVSYDEENILLTFINQEDAQVTQTLLDAVSRAEAALADGTASQTTYDELQAAYERFLSVANTVQVPYNNQIAYTRLTKKLAALQTKLDKAKATVAEDCKDVAGDFAETEQAIQDKIDAIAAEVEAQYKDIALTAESTLGSADVEAEIEKLLADAAEAQKPFDNEAAHARLTEELAALQTKLDEAKATVAEDCKDVAGDFAETEQAIQDKIDAIAAEIEAQYKDIALTEESTLGSADVEAEIEKLLTEATAAQKAFTANEEAHARLTEELAALQTKLDEAKATVAEDCKDVAEDFAETEQEIRKRIDAIADKIKEQYENGALTEESTLGSADVEAEIEKLLTEATAAQKAFTANEEAHARLTGDLAGLQETLDKAIATVAEDCKDVAADFAETEQAIQDMIDAIAAEVEKQYEDIALTAESTIDTEGIKAEIEKLLSDAAEAQKAYETITGIYGIEGIAGQQIKIYTANGQLVNAVVKGQVNILVFPDGTVKRVYVK